MPPEKMEFAAWLIFDCGGGRRSIEPHTFTAQHPYVAYQCALAKGAEDRVGRKFAGLAELAVRTERIPNIGKIEGGSAQDLVLAQEQLSAFKDARWIGVPYDDAELEGALAGPPLLFSLRGLEVVKWADLGHAYGPAVDIPATLTRLASSDATVRAQALWNLGGNIFHQGSIYSATAAAIPFLVELAANPLLPNRAAILELLTHIAASGAATHPEKIRRGWAKREKDYPKMQWRRPVAEIAEEQIRDGLAVQKAMDDAIEVLTALCDCSDSEVARGARDVISP